MKRMYGIFIACFLMILLAGCAASNEEKHVPGEPDVVSSIKSNQDENFVVVANRDSIEDKVEFAKLLVKMCQENSFKTIKFSTDFGYATSLDIRVYLWKDEIQGHEPVMRVEFKPIEWNQKYDIVNNPDKFQLLVDGEVVE